MARPPDRFSIRRLALIEDLSEQRKRGRAARWAIGTSRRNRPSSCPSSSRGRSSPAGFSGRRHESVPALRHRLQRFCRFACRPDCRARSANARAYEAERRRAEALAEIDRAKTTFFSNVSHELRTPLTLMLSPVEELLSPHGREYDSGGAGTARIWFIATVCACRNWSTRCSISRASRPDACRPIYEPTELAAFTAELASNFRSAMEKAGLDFQDRVRPRFAEPVYIDREMWEKIVLNLLSNALKFTFDGQRDRVADAVPDGMPN